MLGQFGDNGKENGNYYSIDDGGWDDFDAAACHFVLITFSFDLGLPSLLRREYVPFTRLVVNALEMFKVAARKQNGRNIIGPDFAPLASGIAGSGVPVAAPGLSKSHHMDLFAILPNSKSQSFS